MSKQKISICKHCGNIAGYIIHKGAPLFCCGEKMSEMVPNTTEASTEKHLPVATVSGDEISVAVGSTAHPMEDAHHIVFVYVETAGGGQRKNLAIGAAPAAVFAFADDKPLAVYAYCNLHGLWKTEM